MEGPNRLQGGKGGGPYHGFTEEFFAIHGFTEEFFAIHGFTEEFFAIHGFTEVISLDKRKSSVRSKDNNPSQNKALILNEPE